MNMLSLQRIILVLLIVIVFQGCKKPQEELGEISQPTVQTIADHHGKDASSFFDKRYAHVVYFWLKKPENREDRTLFETSLRTFLDQSEYAQTQYIGTAPAAIRTVVDDSFTYNLIVTFASPEAQAAYQSEAAHKAFVAQASHLWEKVIVYDSNSIP